VTDKSQRKQKKNKDKIIQQVHKLQQLLQQSCSNTGSTIMR
jgi:hypothetical protein